MLLVRRVHPRDLSQLGRRSVEGKYFARTQCSNLKGLPEPHIRHLARQVGVRPSFPSVSSSLRRSIVSMADVRHARAEHRAALTARVAQIAPIGGPPRRSPPPAANTTTGPVGNE